MNYNEFPNNALTNFKKFFLLFVSIYRFRIYDDTYNKLYTIDHENFEKEFNFIMFYHDIPYCKEEVIGPYLPLTKLEWEEIKALCKIYAIKTKRRFNYKKKKIKVTEDNFKKIFNFGKKQIIKQCKKNNIVREKGIIKPIYIHYDDESTLPPEIIFNFIVKKRFKTKIYKFCEHNLFAIRVIEFLKAKDRCKREVSLTFLAYKNNEGKIQF